MPEQFRMFIVVIFQSNKKCPQFEPPHDKTNKMVCAPTSEDSDQPCGCPGLICVFAGHTGHVVSVVMLRLIHAFVMLQGQLGDTRCYESVQTLWRLKKTITRHTMTKSKDFSVNRVLTFWVCRQYAISWNSFYVNKMSLVTRKSIFGVSDQVRLKPACAATEAS